MSHYQFRPAVTAKTWSLLGVAVIAVLVLPALLNLVTPDVDAKTVNVSLGSEQDRWEMSMFKDDSSRLQCEESMSDLLTPTWDCGGATLTSMVVWGSKDQDTTLRRMMRLNSMIDPGDDVPILHKGGVRIISSPEIPNQIGLSLERPSDDVEHTGTLFVLVDGPEFDSYAELVFNNLRAEEARIAGGEHEPMTLEELTKGFDKAHKGDAHT